MKKIDDKELDKISAGKGEPSVKKLANGNFTVSFNEFETEADANVFYDHMKEHKKPPRHHGAPGGREYY